MGRSNGAGKEEQSDFAFLVTDTHADEFWTAVKEVLEQSDSD